jgi:hypothetical protein
MLRKRRIAAERQKSAVLPAPARSICGAQGADAPPDFLVFAFRRLSKVRSIASRGLRIRKKGEL